MTNVNRPRVRILMGRVRIKIIGFMSAFMIPRPMATIKAVVKVLTWKPGTYFATIKSARAEIIQFAATENGPISTLYSFGQVSA